MNLFRSCMSVLLLALTIACSNPAEPAALLEGRWVAARRNLTPSGWDQQSLSLGASGSFAWEYRAYGIYEGQRSRDLSGWQRTEGTYKVEGNQVVFITERFVWWDSFYGADSPARTGSPPLGTGLPYQPIFYDGNYEIDGRQLTLHFSDGPEATQLVLMGWPRSTACQGLGFGGCGLLFTRSDAPPSVP